MSILDKYRESDTILSDFYNELAAIYIKTKLMEGYFLNSDDEAAAKQAADMKSKLDEMLDDLMVYLDSQASEGNHPSQPPKNKLRLIQS